MRWLLDLSIALTRSWAAIYTRGLPSATRAERREEIDCDLWHQQRLADLEREPVTGTAIEVLIRWLFGIPSDITWRIETGASVTKGRTSMNDTLTMRIGFLVAMLPLAVLGAMGLSFLLGNGDFDSSLTHWLWRGAFLACPLVGSIGLWLCATRPNLGMGLVVVGVGLSSVLMYWMAFITVPLALVIIIFAAFRAGFLPRPSSRQQPA